MALIGRQRWRYIFPVVNQGLISLSNLALGLLLARETSADEYGLYVLGLSIALTLVGVQESLVSVPLTVRTANLAVAGKKRLFRVSSRVLGLANLAAGCVAVTATACAAWLGMGSNTAFVAAMAFAAFGWAAWDFKRVECFAIGRQRTLLFIDFVYLGLISILVIALYTSASLSAAAVLGCVGVAGTLAALTASRPSELVESHPRKPARVVRYWWALGRWSFATAQATSLQSQGYVYIVSVILGLGALGAVAAARMLFAPLATMQVAWSRLALPKLAAASASGGWNAVRPLVTKSLIFLGGVHVIWAIAVLLSIDVIGRVVFLGKFDGIVILAICWACAMTANAFRGVIFAAIRAFGEYRRMTKLALIGAAVVMAGTPPAAWSFGPAGAIVAFGSAELLLGVLALQSLRRQNARKHRD